MLSDILLEINNYKTRSSNMIKNIIEKNKLRLTKLKESYVLKNPLSLYEIKEQKLDNIIDKLNININNIINISKSKLDIIKGSMIFKEPSILYDNKWKKTNHLIEKLEILNPLNALKRGYSIVKKDGKSITDINKVNKDDTLDISVKDVIIKTKVMEVKNGN